MKPNTCLRNSRRLSRPERSFFSCGVPVFLMRPSTTRHVRHPSESSSSPTAWFPGCLLPLTIPVAGHVNHHGTGQNEHIVFILRDLHSIGICQSEPLF